MRYIDRLVDPKQKRHVQCNICNDMLVDPRYSSICYHRFCFQCITTRMEGDAENSNTCPADGCQQLLSQSDIIELMLLIIAYLTSPRFQQNLFKI